MICDKFDVVNINNTHRLDIPGMTNCKAIEGGVSPHGKDAFEDVQWMRKACGDVKYRACHRVCQVESSIETPSSERTYIQASPKEIAWLSSYPIFVIKLNIWSS